MPELATRPNGGSTPAMYSATSDGSSGVLRVAFLLMPEFTLLAFTSFIEALRIAADEWDRSRQIACAWVVLLTFR